MLTSGVSSVITLTTVNTNFYNSEKVWLHHQVTIQMGTKSLPGQRSDTGGLGVPGHGVGVRGVRWSNPGGNHPLFLPLFCGRVIGHVLFCKKKTILSLIHNASHSCNLQYTAMLSHLIDTYIIHLLLSTVDSKPTFLVIDECINERLIVLSSEDSNACITCYLWKTIMKYPV